MAENKTEVGVDNIWEYESIFETGLAYESVGPMGTGIV
jgi:hypothetical protein